MSEAPTATDLVDRLWAVSKRLDDAGIAHERQVYRYDAVSTLAHVPGECREIDFEEDGGVDVEVYRSIGPVEEADAIERLIANFGEKSD